MVDWSERGKLFPHRPTALIHFNFNFPGVLSFPGPSSIPSSTFWACPPHIILPHNGLKATGMLPLQWQTPEWEKTIHSMYRDDVTAATTIPPIATSSNSNLRLREILVEKHKHGVAIREDPKAVMKLWKEADRLNAILSANTKASARVRVHVTASGKGMKVTRQAFESACADMKDRFVQPIFDSLNNSNLTLSIKLSDIAPYDVQLISPSTRAWTRLVSVTPMGLEQKREARQWVSLSLVTPVRLRHSRSLIKMEAEEAAIAARENNGISVAK
ncbi:hypothetical protein EDB85DRAFT_2146628 [Lactarius pseudohatsudake]|nr:hypothetical protein EDB85DRAFT_2146628 [Lactarius pseudohatsudake]